MVRVPGLRVAARLPDPPPYSMQKWVYERASAPRPGPACGPYPPGGVACSERHSLGTALTHPCGRGGTLARYPPPSPQVCY